MPQTSYSINIPAASYPGQHYDNGLNDVNTALAYAAAIVFGTLVIQDATNTVGPDQLCGRAPSASADITTVGLAMGVALANQALAQNPAVTNPTYPQFYAVPVMRIGRLWVLAETALADSAAPFVRYTANGSFTPGLPGCFRGDADSGKAAQLASTQASVTGTTSAAGYAVIECAFV